MEKIYTEEDLKVSKVQIELYDGTNPFKITLDFTLKRPKKFKVNCMAQLMTNSLQAFVLEYNPKAKNKRDPKNYKVYCIDKDELEGYKKLW